MFDKARTEAHRRLVGRMAATVGAAPAAPADAAAALERCCTCGHVGTCEDWLEDHADGAEAAPGFCANRDMLAALRPAQAG